MQWSTTGNGQWSTIGNRQWSTKGNRQCSTIGNMQWSIGKYQSNGQGTASLGRKVNIHPSPPLPSYLLLYFDFFICDISDLCFNIKYFAKFNKISAQVFTGGACYVCGEELFMTISVDNKNIYFAIYLYLVLASELEYQKYILQ